MRWTSMLAIYVLFWAFSVFLVLPWGVRTTREAGGDHVPGQAESAPVNFSPKRVAIRATILSAILFGAYYLNYVNGWITTDMVDLVN